MKIIGHRGALGLAPENTAASIKKALDHNVDEIEIDVRVTKDNVPILCHDHKLNDASGRFVIVKDTNLEELRKHKPDLTTLSTALELSKGKILCVEIKPKVDVKPIIAELKKAVKENIKPEEINIASYSLSILKRVKQELPDIQLVVNERWSGVRGGHRARKLKTKRLNMYQLWLWRGYVRPLANRNIKIYAFTVNDVAKAKKLSNIGVAGIITDYPDRFEKV